MKAHLARSSLTGIAQFFTSTLAVMVTIPVFVHHLGPEAYGVFSLVGVIGSLNAFTNLGLNSSLTRFLSAQGQTAESDHDIIVTFAILGAVLVPVTVLGVVFRNTILSDLLKVPRGFLGDVQWLYIAMLVGNSLILVGQTFTAMMDSVQKVYLTNSFQMVYSVLYWGLIFTVLSLGYSLDAVAVAVLVAAVAWFCIVAVGGLRAWGGVSFAGLRSDALPCARKQLSYGIQMYTAGLAGFMYEPLTKILVSHYMGSTEVGIFDIGLRVRNQLFNLAIRAFSPLFPMIAQLKDQAKIRALVHDVEQKTLMLAVPVVAVVVLTVKPAASLFFQLNVDAIAVTVACLVSASLLASVCVIPNYQFLLAKGHVRNTIVVQCVNVLVNAGVLLACVRIAGYYAVVAANVVATVAAGGLVLYYQKRYLDSLIFDSLRQPAYLCATFVAALGLGFLCGNLIDAPFWRLAVVPLMVLCVTVTCFRYFSMVQASDIARYLGEGSGASRMLTRLLCQSEGAA